MSINVDKALDIIPPLAGEIYVSRVAPPGGAQGVFEIPGVRVSQGGGAESENQHRFLANFISVQAEGGDVYVAFGADPTIAADGTGLAGTSNVFFGNNPEPATEGCARIADGETLRVDLTALTQRLTLTPAVPPPPAPPVTPATYIDRPVQYMAVDLPGGARVRVWRSSGTGQ